MENLSREELLLVKEKFPDTLISKFFDEYFPNDGTESISAVKSTPSDESVPKCGSRPKLSSSREKISNKNSYELITTGKQNYPDSQIDGSRTHTSTEILHKDEVLTAHENLLKLYDDFFHTLSPIKNTLDESNFALRYRIRESVNNMKATSPVTSHNIKPIFQEYQISTKTRIAPSKKSVKMTVPSNKRQILEEEFRREKYPSNEKLQKMSVKLSMRYDEVQNYFKKRRREEKETNHKFSNLVKLLDNYLEQED